MHFWYYKKEYLFHIELFLFLCKNNLNHFLFFLIMIIYKIYNKLYSKKNYYFNILIFKKKKRKGTIGIEPMTSWSAVKCSTTELSTQVNIFINYFIYNYIWQINKIKSEIKFNLLIFNFILFLFVFLIC